MSKYTGLGLTALAAAVDRIEPYLIETCWPATTSMMIPSVLRSAEELAAAIAACSDADAADAAALAARLEALRAEQRRISAERRARDGGVPTGQPREWRGPRQT